MVCGCLCWLAKAVVIDLLAQAVTSTVTVTETFPVVVQPVQTVPVQGTGSTQGVSWSLVVSGLAFLVSLGSLLWNAVSWWRSGARIKLQISTAKDDLGNPHLLVAVANAGRVGTHISYCAIGRKAGSDKEVFGLKPYRREEMPVSLEPGKEVLFSVSFSMLGHALKDPNLNLAPSKVAAMTGHGVFYKRIPKRVRRELGLVA